MEAFQLQGFPDQLALLGEGLRTTRSQHAYEVEHPQMVLGVGAWDQLHAVDGAVDQLLVQRVLDLQEAADEGGGHQHPPQVADSLAQMPGTLLARQAGQLQLAQVPDHRDDHVLVDFLLAEPKSFPEVLQKLKHAGASGDLGDEVGCWGHLKDVLLRLPFSQDPHQAGKIVLTKAHKSIHNFSELFNTDFLHNHMFQPT